MSVFLEVEALASAEPFSHERGGVVCKLNWHAMLSPHRLRNSYLLLRSYHPEKDTFESHRTRSIPIALCSHLLQKLDCWPHGESLLHSSHLRCRIVPWLQAASRPRRTPSYRDRVDPKTARSWMWTTGTHVRPTFVWRAACVLPIQDTHHSRGSTTRCPATPGLLLFERH